MALQFQESYGIRATNDRHTSLDVSCKIKMCIFKIAPVISGNACIVFLSI